MAITKYAGDRYVGLSSDTKPTNVSDGAIFTEIDTLEIFLLVSGSWERIKNVLSNDEYLQAVDVAGTGKIDILKVNTEDEVEAGSKFNFGLLEFAPRTEPISPDQDGLYLYEVASGNTPAREIKLVAKNQLGEEIIAFTLIV